MCVPMCAGRFLDMPEVRPQRGAASGGKRRSHGAAESMAAPQAASCRARAAPSGRSRARSIARGASPHAGRRSCALRSTRACAGDAAARRGWPPLCWDLFCACTEWRGTPVWSPHGEMWSRDVFVSLRELVIGYYNMYDTISKEFTRSTIISRTRSRLSGTTFCRHGPTGHEAIDDDARLVGDARRILRTDAEQRGQLRSRGLQLGRREERRDEAEKPPSKLTKQGKPGIRWSVCGPFSILDISRTR